MIEFPDVNVMTSALIEMGVETKGVCYNCVTLLYSMMTRKSSLENLLAAAQLDRDAHQNLGPESFGFESSNEPFDIY